MKSWSGHRLLYQKNIVSLFEDQIYLGKQCRLWWNATLCDIASWSSVFAVFLEKLRNTELKSSWSVWMKHILSTILNAVANIKDMIKLSSWPRLEVVSMNNDCYCSSSVVSIEKQMKTLHPRWSFHHALSVCGVSRFQWKNIYIYEQCSVLNCVIILCVHIALITWGRYYGIAVQSIYNAIFGVNNNEPCYKWIVL